MSCFLSGLKDEIRLPVRSLVPKSLNEAFGLATIQEEYLLSSRKGFGNVADSRKASILGLPPNLKLRLNHKLRFLYKGCLAHRWREGGNKGCVITVMRNGRLGINVRVQNYSY